MRNSTLKPISPKQIRRLAEYSELVNKLRRLSGNVSELSGQKPDWASGYVIEPHHITGRIGKKLCDPFNIILLTRAEHNKEQSNMSYERKRELLAFIRPIRIKQGFTEG